MISGQTKVFVSFMKKAFIQLHIAVFLAGFTAILGNIISLKEGVLVWYRLLFTIIILGVFLLLKKKLEKISAREALKITAVGGVIALHWLTFYGSIKYANVSVALVCLSSSSFFSAVTEPFFLKKKMVYTELILSLFSIAGIYIIFDFHPQYKTGILFGMVSAFLSAVFPIFNKQLLGTHQPRLLTLYELTGGFLVLTLVFPLYNYFFPAVEFIPTGADVFWLLILSVICTIIAFEMQLNALRSISAFSVNLSFSLEPIYGIALAFLFFGENKLFHSQFYIGLLLILLAVIFQMWRLFRQSKKIISDVTDVNALNIS